MTKINLPGSVVSATGTVTAGLVLSSAGSGSSSGSWTSPSGLVFNNGIYVTENTTANSTFEAEHEFMIAPRPNTGLAYPVPFVRPVQTNSIVAMDLGPNGTPSSGTTTVNGTAWFDVCNYDFYGGDVSGATQAGNTLRLAAWSDHSEVSTRSYGTANPVPLYLSAAWTVGKNPQIYLAPMTGTYPAVILGYDGSDVFAGTNAAIATTATKGFFFPPVMAGTPTGTPHYTSQPAVVLDSTNNKLWAYLNGAWKGVTLS
jgi:hypothetical protein